MNHSALAVTLQGSGVQNLPDSPIPFREGS